MKEYADYVAALGEVEPALASELAGLRSLQSVFAWMTRRRLALGTVDVVTQDEYCHDFLVPLGPDGRHVVFGIT